MSKYYEFFIVFEIWSGEFVTSKGKLYCPYLIRVDGSENKSACRQVTHILYNVTSLACDPMHIVGEAPGWYYDNVKDCLFEFKKTTSRYPDVSVFVQDFLLMPKVSSKNEYMDVHYPQQIPFRIVPTRDESSFYVSMTVRGIAQVQRLCYAMHAWSTPLSELPSITYDVSWNQTLKESVEILRNINLQHGQYSGECNAIAPSVAANLDIEKLTLPEEVPAFQSIEKSNYIGLVAENYEKWRYLHGGWIRDLAVQSGVATHKAWTAVVRHIKQGWDKLQARIVGKAGYATDEAFLLQAYIVRIKERFHTEDPVLSEWLSASHLLAKKIADQTKSIANL